jgi:hypothetical protein
LSGVLLTLAKLSFAGAISEDGIFGDIDGEVAKFSFAGTV